MPCAVPWAHCVLSALAFFLVSSTGLILNSRQSTTCSLRYVWPPLGLLLMGFFRKVPPDVAGFHMAYLLQEESGERNTFLTEFSGLEMVSVGASVVPEVLSACRSAALCTVLG